MVKINKTVVIMKQLELVQLETTQADVANQCCFESDRNVPTEGETENCECMNGNSFFHVMTRLNEGDTESAPWKKRYSIQQPNIS